MIKTFRNKALAAFHEDRTNTRRLPVHGKARIDLVGEILDALDAATQATDLNQPGYRLHSLDPGQPGRWSVRVTGNYRITFSWNDGPADVDIEDYH